MRIFYTTKNITFFSLFLTFCFVGSFTILWDQSYPKFQEQITIQKQRQMQKENRQEQENIQMEKDKQQQEPIDFHTVVNKQQEQLNSQIDQVVKQVSDLKWEENEITWRLEIPTIALDAPIAEGTSDEIMNSFIGHFEDTPTDLRKCLFSSS